MARKQIKLINTLFKMIYPYTYEKIEAEINEHFNFVTWVAKRILLPVALFYVVLGLVLNVNIYDSLLLSLLIFVYSSLLPDVDILFKKARNENQDSLWYEKYSMLFFAPLIIYYMLAGKARKLYSLKPRPFHNFKTVLIYGFFLLVISSILWNNPLERVFPTLLGMLGFTTHLVVDKFSEGIKTFIIKK